MSRLSSHQSLISLVKLGLDKSGCNAPRKLGKLNGFQIYLNVQVRRSEGEREGGRGGGG